MRRIAGLLVATSHLGFASYALAEAPVKGPAVRRAVATSSGARTKRRDSLRAPAPEATQATLKKVFTLADKGNDGSVSFSELATVVNKSLAGRIAERFHQLDRNHDGWCTRGEVDTMSLARFSRFDLNRDGRFTQQELAVVLKRELALKLEQVYARLDVDRDGRFSMAELTSVRPSAPTVVARNPLEVASRGASPLQ